jgi:nitrogen fixation NifU-like protein
MFDRQAFIDNLLDHYENPRHRGHMDDATVTIKGGNPGCGDIITVYLKLDEAERIQDVSFEGEGCTISQAAASILSEQIIGKTLEDIINMDHTQFVEDLGREVVINRLKCATLALNTVKAAERKFHMQQAENSAESGTDEVIQF